MRALKIIKTFFLKELADPLGLKLLELENGQLSTNRSTNLIGRDVEYKRKKSCNWLRDDITDIWLSKKLYFWRNHKKMFNQLTSVN